MQQSNKISLPVIKRLPKYYRYLKLLKQNGKERISSRELSTRLGVTASQIRQDFNCFGEMHGRQGVGYQIDVLIEILEKLLLNGERIPTILIGAGHIGKAVSRFITTDANGYKLIAVFDSSENEVGKQIGDITVQHIETLERFCKENKPQVAVLCVPRTSSKELSSKLVELGIQGFWNFSHYDLSVPYPNVVVENVHLGDSLMSLGFRLRNENN